MNYLTKGRRVRLMTSASGETTGSFAAGTEGVLAADVPCGMRVAEVFLKGFKLPFTVGLENLLVLNEADTDEPPPRNGYAGSALPEDSAERKTYPLYSGLLAYFPAALAAVAHHSWVGNEKHNPGQRLHHSRGKSMDHADCVLRHMVNADEVSGPAKVTELAAAAWRILAMLQEETEKQGAPLAPGATNDKDDNA